MTITQAIHLIEQFAAQAPFAVWITDSRGITIFANRKLHELFAIPEHPSGALGFNLFEDPMVKALNLTDLATRARAGEVVDTVIDIPRSEQLSKHFGDAVTRPLTLRATCYALRSSAQKIEHHVILLSDITEGSRHREELKTQLHDLAIYDKSRGARLARIRELEEEIGRLEGEIQAHGAEPAS